MKKSIIWIMLVSIAVLAIAVTGGCGKTYENYEVVNSPGGEETTPVFETTPYVALTWQTIYEVAGSEAKKITPAFYLGSGEKRILYNYAPIDDYSGVFAAYIMAEGTSLAADGGSPDVQPQAAGNGETRLIRDAGMYHVEIIGPNCSWQVTVQEMK